VDGSLGDNPTWKEVGVVGQGLLRSFDVTCDYSRPASGDAQYPLAPARWRTAAASFPYSATSHA